MDKRISVLMSVYYKEKPEYLSQCLDSLLAQTHLADEWVIVEDGKLTAELYSVLSKYENAHPGLINRVPLENNRGLGLALREGILHCSYELVARMDTDDVSRKDRFELQLREFEKDPQLDVCGSHIEEFYTTPDEIVTVRKVPLTDADIKKYQKKRDGFNHVTVMYKKSAVLRAGNYQNALLMEDSLLWVNMIQSGAKCMNIDDSLVFVRTGMDMYERRGGLSYYRKYKAGRKKILDTGYISYLDYLETLAIQFGVAIAPAKLRKFVFTKFLRGGAELKRIFDTLIHAEYGMPMEVGAAI